MAPRTSRDIYIHALWSPNYSTKRDTGTSLLCSVSRVGNAMPPCHRTGYDRHDSYTSYEREKNRQQQKHDKEKKKCRALPSEMWQMMQNTRSYNQT